MIIASIIFVICILLAIMWETTKTSIDKRDLRRGLEAYKNANYRAALPIIQPLAKAGYAKAQLTLAEMYALGRGVPKDPITAFIFFSLADAQGEPEAMKFRANIANELTPENLEQAKILTTKYLNEQKKSKSVYRIDRLT